MVNGPFFGISIHFDRLIGPTLIVYKDFTLRSNSNRINFVFAISHISSIFSALQIIPPRKYLYSGYTQVRHAWGNPYG